MILEPVKASGWLSTNLSIDERGILMRSGIVPVNDVLFPCWADRSKIQLYYGGRGGGKSVFIFQKLINQCRKEKYFKCFYGRKVFDTIRETCFQTLISGIEEMGLSHEFNYSDAKEGSMKVIHIPTGNSFIPFGSDKAKKLKSLKDPTVIYCEEFEEFEFEDFKELLPTLRTEKAETQFIAAFNTHNIYPDNSWIIKVFFPHLYTGKEVVDKDLLDGIDIKKIFVNYPDNYFIDHEQYRQTLWLAAGGNMILFEAMANGDWGVIENNNPWLYHFDQTKHIKSDIRFLPDYPVYLSFDFNNDPFACIATQFSPVKGTRNSFIHHIQEFVGAHKVEDMCQRIRTAFPSSILYVTGDSSGNNKDLGRNQTLYQMIGDYLNLAPKQMNLLTHNLTHADSRIFINALYKDYPNVYISKKGCPALIMDCQKAMVEEKNGKPSQLRKDREGFKMDAFDAMRYFYQCYFHEYAKDVYFKVMSKR